MPLGPVVAVLAITIVVACLVVLRPGLTAVRGGKILAFLGFFIFPAMAAMLGFESHLERSKETSFCLTCHIMGPYGRSLYVDDPSFIPAAHFQPSASREFHDGHETRPAIPATRITRFMADSNRRSVGCTTFTLNT